MSESDLLNPGVNICPVINLAECEKLVGKLYGKKCEKISELNSYDDKNFKVVDEKGAKFVFKILNSLDSKKLHVVEAQNEMLLYLGKKGIFCPQPVPNLSGQYCSLESLQSGQHVVRLMKFIEGQTLYELKHVAKKELYYKIGQYLGMVDCYLKDFQNDAYDNHRSVWMLDCVPQLRNFTFALKNPSDIQLIDSVIAEFEEKVLSKKSQLSQGLIHGDFNEQNVVIDKEGQLVLGLLDFADVQNSCYIYEVAIAMAYMIIVSEDLSVGGLVLAGYINKKPLSTLEISLLRLCILGRMCQSLVMGAYSAHLNPQNSHYLLTTSKAGWKLFHQMLSKTDSELATLWTSAPSFSSS